MQDCPSCELFRSLTAYGGWVEIHNTTLWLTPWLRIRSIGWGSGLTSINVALAR